MKKLIVFVCVFFNIFIIFDLVADLVAIYGGIYLEPVITEPGPRYENRLPYDKTKTSIATMGCSFTEGDGIAEEETFAYKLQKETGRKTYNLGLSGHGIQHVLYLIQTYKLFNQSKKNEIPEYVIYIFIDDHLRRMYKSSFLDESFKNQTYFRIGNHLYRRTPEITFWDYIEMSPFGGFINYSRFLIASDAKRFKLFKLYIDTCNRELKKRNPNTKFVILVYDNYNLVIPTERWREFENEGIKVLRFDGGKYDYLQMPEYRSSIDHAHPSGRAWDDIVPVVIEQLQLK
jgi:hypothetical protein